MWDLSKIELEILFHSVEYSEKTILQIDPREIIIHPPANEEIAQRMENDTRGMRCETCLAEKYQRGNHSNRKTVSSSFYTGEQD